MKSLIRLNTRTKMIIGFGILMFSIIAIQIFTYAVISKIKHSQDSMIVANAASKELTQLRYDETRLRVSILLMILSRDQEEGDSLHIATRDKIAEANARLNHIKELLAGTSVNQGQIGEASSVMAALRENMKHQLSLINQGKFEEARLYTLNFQNAFYERVRMKIVDLENTLQKETILSLDKSNDLFDKITTWLIIFNILIILISFTFTLALFRLIQTVFKEIRNSALWPPF